MRITRRTFCAGAAALPFAGSARASDPPRVSAVNYALAYFAEQLAGADADVVFPVPEGRDPALWRPSIADISDIQSAKLIVLNGAGFAKWTTKASLPRSRVIDTSRAFKDRFIKTETITHSHGADGEHSHEGVATYFWLDQSLAALQAEAVAAGLKRARIGAPADIETRLAALKQTLASLHASAGALPGAGADTPIIATHPRYHYFARAYGLKIDALEWEAGAAPSAAQLAELTDLVAAKSARVMIWEAEPPAEAFDAVEALGLANVVFPPLATRPAGGDYTSAFGRAVADTRAALEALE